MSNLLEWGKKYKFWLIWTPFSGLWVVVSFCIASIYLESTRGLAFLLASPLVIVGLYFASKRTSALESQNQIDSNRLLTETFAKSIELLGNEQSAVRQGAIYALGKIGTNKEELVVIINTLCAFIRHNKPHSESLENVETLYSLPIDIEAAIKTIVKISSFIEKNSDVTYDLSNIELKYADFSNANLSKFNLSDSNFHKCIFEKVKFHSSNLVGANFKGSDFNDSEFKQTELHKTNLSEVENLTQEQIDLCLGDAETKLPKEMIAPKSWAE